MKCAINKYNVAKINNYVKVFRLKLLQKAQKIASKVSNRKKRCRVLISPSSSLFRNDVVLMLHKRKYFNAAFLLKRK